MIKHYERIRYPDGGVYCKINKIPLNDTRYEFHITERINNYEDLFFLGSIVDAYKSRGVHDIHLTIPCMFQQQHDRRFENNESFELKLVCDFINRLNFKSISVFKPHSDCVLMGLNNSKALNNNFYPSIISAITNGYDDNLVVLSPDAGSFKWIYKECESARFKGDIYTASKVRDHATHKLINIIDREDFGGKDVLLMDDLSVFGGTFINLAKILKTKNVGKIYLAVAHLTVKNPNKELETLFETVYTTNSKFDKSEYDLKNLNVTNLF